MKRWILALVVLAGCGKPLYESNPGSSTGSSGSTGVSQDLVVTGTRRAPNVMFVVDRSGSMADSPDGSQASVCTGMTGQHDLNCKWQQLLTVMAGDGSSAEPGYVQQMQDSLSSAAGEPAQLGLITFSGGNDACEVGVVQQAIAPNSASTIDSVLATIEPLGATPTAATLAVAGQNLQAAPDSVGRDSYVVLLTDGAPNCDANFQVSGENCLEGTQACASEGACFNADGSPQSPQTPLGCLDEEASVAAVQNLHDNGINTFVIGFGADFADTNNLANDTLNKMALAGGEALSTSGGLTGTSFYRASSAADLASSLGDVAGALQNRCSFRLSQAAPETISAAKVQSGNDTISIDFGSMLLSADRMSVTLSDSVCQQVMGSQVTFRFTP